MAWAVCNRTVQLLLVQSAVEVDGWKGVAAGFMLVAKFAVVDSLFPVSLGSRSFEVGSGLLQILRWWRP